PPKKSCGCGRSHTDHGARREASMRKRRRSMSKILVPVLALALLAGPAASAVFAQAKEVFIPLLVYRTGPYAPSGIPIANGFVDYFTLINERDGGINGVKLAWEECETQYDTKQGVECYERLKGKGPTGAVVVNPYSTGISYQLIPDRKSTRLNSSHEWISYAVFCLK